MFSYEVNVRKINSAKLKGVASIIIEGIMEIDGFKIIEGSNGLFVSVPSHKGSVMEDGQRVEKYFDDVKFKGEDGLLFSKELKDSILSSFMNASDPLGSSSTRQQSQSTTSAKSTTVKARDEAATAAKPQASGPDRNRKPLWEF
jgi:hypothetical protein